jgi:hypothetical protein
MGIIATVQSGLPDGDFFSGAAVQFATPWLGKEFISFSFPRALYSNCSLRFCTALTITFNVVATALIIVRLTCVIRDMRDVFAGSRAEVYLGFISILIQSALPFTLLGIGYLIAYVTRAPESLAFASIWGAFVVRPFFSSSARGRY